MNSVNQNTITVTKNDTSIIEVQITLDYEDADLTGCTNRILVKENINDDDSVAVIDITNDNSIPETDLTIGLIYFKFAATNTVNLESKKYFYSISITNIAGDKFTVRRGDFYILNEQ